MKTYAFSENSSKWFIKNNICVIALACVWCGPCAYLEGGPIEKA